MTDVLNYENVSGLPANPTIEQEALASIAQSLKRVADILDAREEKRVEAPTRFTGTTYIDVSTQDDAREEKAGAGTHETNDEVLTVAKAEQEALNRGGTTGAFIRRCAARIAELEREREHMLPLSDDGKYVFVDGHGLVELDFGEALRKRAEKAEVALAELRAGLRALRGNTQSGVDHYASADSTASTVVGYLEELVVDMNALLSPEGGAKGEARPPRDADPVPATLPPLELARMMDHIAGDAPEGGPFGKRFHIKDAGYDDFRVTGALLRDSAAAIRTLHAAYIKGGTGDG